MVWRERKAQRAARRAEALRKGDIIRRLHWQCWRADAPPLDVPVAELIEVLPVLIESGSVGLVWPRLAHRAEELGAVGAALAAAYEAQVAHNSRVEGDIVRVVTRLREHGVEPVLIKGYAVARLYPTPLVRPAGDIDLVVRDEDYAAAGAALADLRVSFHGDTAARRAHEARLRDGGDGHGRGDDEHRPYDIDLHRYSTWYGAGPDEARFFAQGAAMIIATTDVRVPRVEDHVRALCLHFLRHGAVRPVRLCDIALLLETSPALDWERLVQGTAREREQIVVALRLAEELLGATTPPPPDALPTQLPAWLEPVVLRQWVKRAPGYGEALPEIRRKPHYLFDSFTKRWPDQLSATIRVNALFDDSTRLPIQVAAYAKHIGLYARRLMRRR